jgi:hypothetical protein
MRQKKLASAIDLLIELIGILRELEEKEEKSLYLINSETKEGE